MPIIERMLSRPIYLAAIVFIAAFVVYSMTLAPGVDFIDAGELATDCWVLGIAHPTGYPLFTIIGWVFAHLPIASSVILRLNDMAAFFTAAGAGVLTLLAFEIFRYWMPARVKKQKTTSLPKGKQKQSTARVVGGPRAAHSPAPEGAAGGALHAAEIHATEDPSVPVLAAFATGLAAAFSSTWWSQSTAIEVYPLHLFMVPIVLTFFLRMVRKEEGFRLGWDGRLFALTLGLSFANHMTTILLAPACLYLYFARYGFSSASWQRIFGLAPLFLAGLLVYLYLPIRSAQYPIMDWGHPATLGSFLRHVTGGQYKIWMFTGTGAAAKQWGYFWHRVPIEFTLLGALLAIVGIGRFSLIPGAGRAVLMVLVILSAIACVYFGLIPYGGKGDSPTEHLYYVLGLLVPLYFAARFLARMGNFKHILGFTLLLFFGCLLYSINYDIHDIDSYFLLAYLAMALCIGAGLLALIQFLQISKAAAVVLAAAALVIGGAEIYVNYAEADESGNHFVDDYATNMLRNLPPNAIIFSTQWDFWVSGAFYYQIVEKMRPDVLVIDKAMLRDRPWYYAELAQRAPEVFRRVKPEEDAFLKFLWAFDRGDKFDQAAIAPAYERFTSALVERNLDRPIFVTQEMVDQPDDLFAPKMKAVPAGIAYRLLPRDSTLEASVPKLQWRDANYRKRNYYTDDSRILQALPIVYYAQSLLKAGQPLRAKLFLDAALTFTPDLGASLDDFAERDLSIANAANEKFSQIAALRKQLDAVR